MTEQNIAYFVVGMITIIVMLSCTVWHLLWKIKITERVSSKRLEDIKKLIKQIEDHVDLKQYMQRETANLKAIINKHPEAQMEWIQSLKPSDKKSQVED